MKRIIFYILFLLCLPTMAFAVDGDVTGDGEVDITDFTIFIDYWLQSPVADPNCDFNEDGSINFIDYAIMAGNWTAKFPVSQEPNNVAPVVENINDAWAYTAEIQSINLVGSDSDSGPNSKLYYKIASLPSHGKLTDVSVGAAILQSAPYTLLSPISVITYKSDSGYTGMDSFTYQAYDGDLDSNTATVDVNVISNPLDNLTFNGQGYITVPDANELEFDDDFAFALWLKTEWPYSGIIRKRGSSGAGFELKIIDGRPAAYFYDANDNEKVVIGIPEYKINTGEWVHLSVSHSSTATSIYVDSDQVASRNDIPAISFANSGDLIIGSSGDKPFKGELDRISWYSTAKDGIDAAFLYIEDRDGADGGLFVPAYYTRFNFNEGAGTDVNDMTWGLTGTVNNSNYVQWVAGNAQAQKLAPKLRGRERYRPDTFHFRNYRGSNGY